MAEKDFNVIIMHSIANPEWEKIETIIAEAGYKPRALFREYGADTIFNDLRDIIWDEIHCALILLSGDDLTRENKYRARQNVVFELGYCFGAFDSLRAKARYRPKDALIIVAENDIELFSDIEGLRKILYDKGKLEQKKGEIQNALNNSYSKASQYYEDLK